MKLFDTNVLIYGFDSGSEFHLWAKQALMSAILDQEALVNTVVLAELGVGEAHPETLVTRLMDLGIS